MKNFILFIICSAALPLYAQKVSEIKVDTFMIKKERHTIHKFNPVQVLSKVEGNKKCLFEKEGKCDLWGMEDKIILKVSGLAEANFEGANKIIMKENLLMFDYESGKSIINLELKAVKTNKTGTLVYDNLASLAWGGRIPFEFKIEINSDLNNKDKEIEFRLPIFQSGFSRFKVTYANAKWKVESLPAIPDSYSFSSDLALDLVQVASKSLKTSYAEYNIDCLQVGNVTPTCMASTFNQSARLEPELALRFYKEAKAKLGFLGSYVNFSLNCQEPNQWNEIKQTTCTVSLNE